MTDPRSLPGGAMPPSWSLAVPRELARRLPERVGRPQFGDVNLLDGVVCYREWVPRDQGRRGTCTAFAVAAAEELVDMRYLGRPNRYLSVEHLYAQIRGVSFDEAGIEVPDDELDVLVKSGATFIKQAQLALVAGGTVPEALLPYKPDKPIDHFETDIPGGVIASGEDRRPNAAQLTHNIVNPEEGDLYGDSQIWRDPLEDEAVSDIFLKTLTKGYPIVAGFALLSGVGIGTWLGQRAVRYGEIVYPLPYVVDTLRKHSGHVICITGYIPNTAEEGPHGHFIFRNSYGQFGFARNRDMDTAAPVSPAQGYGLISTDDVDLYCWEYMFRTGH